MGGLWPLVWRSLRRRPGRALVTAIAVGLGVAAVLGVQLTLAALDRQATAAAVQQGGRSDLDVRPVLGRGLTPAQLDAISTLGGVAESAPLDTKRVAARVRGDEIDAITVSIVGLSARGEAALRPVRLLHGRLPRPASLDEAVVDSRVVDALSALGGAPLRIGDRVQLTTATGEDSFRIVGTSDGTAGGPALPRSAVFVSDRAARDPFALGLHTPLVAVRAAPQSSAATLAAAVSSRLGDAVVTSAPPRDGTQPLDGLRPLLVLVTALSVLVGAAVAANSAALGALERRREIGLLRAAGASPRQVLRLLLAEAMVVALAGAAIGMAVGILLGSALVRLVAPADLGVPELALGVGAVASALAAGVAAGLGGCIGPAVAAARMSPLAALRSTPGGAREPIPRRMLLGALPVLVATGCILLAIGRPQTMAAGVALLLVGVSLTLPLTAPLLARALALAVAPIAPNARLAAANLRRRRNRTALCVAGLCSSIALATAIAIVSLGALSAGRAWVDQIVAGDEVLVSPATASDQVAAEIATRDGVTVSRVRYLGAALDGRPTGLASIDVGPYRDQGRLDFVEGSREQALDRLSGGHAVVVPATLAAERGWHLGGSITFEGPDGPSHLAVAGVVAHSLPASDGREAVLLDHQAGVDLLGSQAAGFDDLEVRTGGDAAASRVAASAQGYGLGVQTIASLRDDADAALRHSTNLLEAVAWIGVIVALLAVANTLVANARLGRHELALIRAVGLSRRSARRLVLGESALIAAVGCVLGVVLGCALAVPLLRVGVSPGFSPPFVLPVVASIALLAGVGGATLLLGLGPARRAASPSIVAALHRG